MANENNENKPSNQKPQALVVGINKYEYRRELKNLRVPTVNAHCIATRLKKQGDFEVEQLNNITRKKFKEEIVKLFKANGSNPQMALLYFSGYILVKKETQEVFLATTDSNPDEDYELGVSLQWLKQLLQERPDDEQKQIIILDCCYPEQQKLDINKLLPGYQNKKDRLFLILFHENNQTFLQKNNVCSFLTNAILNILKNDENPSCTDSKILIQKLKEKYEKKLKKCGDYKRINFGKRIDLLLQPNDYENETEKASNDKKYLTENPYQGLESFKKSESDYFFGRQKLTDELLGKLRKNNFLAVMGASGSGKSSVIKAGLIYQLEQGDKISDSDSWETVMFQPGTFPLQSLAEALAEKIRITSKDNTEIQQDKVFEVIDKGVDGLVDFIRKARASRIVLVIDQFEEIFTLCEDNDKRKKFLNCILGALEKLDVKEFCLVIALRADFFGKCAEQVYEIRTTNKQGETKTEFKGLARKIQQNLVAVTPMIQEELEEAIEGPAKELGVDVENGLRDKLVEDVLSEPGSLPLLQYGLKKIWEENKEEWKKEENKEESKKSVEIILKEDNYRPLKEVLEKYADGVYEELGEKNPQDPAIAKYIFLKLIYFGSGTDDTRKRIFIDELIQQNLYSEKDIERVKDKLYEKDLIDVYKEINDKGEKPNVINLVHDSLIRYWSKLQDWLKEYRPYKRFQEDIEHDAEKWEENGFDDKYLYKEKKLEEVDKFKQEYEYILTLSEKAQKFIVQSKDHLNKIKDQEEKDNTKKLRNIIAIATTILICITLLLSQAQINITNIDKERSQQSIALTRYSEKLFDDKQQFDALIEGLQAAVLLNKQELPLPKNIKPLLRQAVDGVKERNRLEGHGGSIYDVDISPDGKILASGSLDETIKLWNLETGEEIIPPLIGHKGKVYSVNFNPFDSTQLASSSADGTIRLWNNLKTGEYKELIGHKAKVYSLSFCPDGKILASSSKDKTIKLWNLETGKEILSLTGHKGKVYSVSFNPHDSKQLASASADGTVRLWNIQTGQNEIISERDYNVYNVGFSPDGKKLASGSNDGTIHIWNFGTGKDFNTLNKHQFSVNSISFNNDSTTLASGSYDNTIKLWDVATGKEITTITGHKDWVYNVSFYAKDGKEFLASGSADKTIRLWDIDKIQSITTLSGHDNWVNSVVFNPQNNNQLASASVDGTIKFWNVKTGDKQSIVTKHKRINSVSFSHDGKILASSSADGSIKLWNTDTLEEIKPALAGHNNWVNSLSFNPKDSTKLASASNDETVKVWDIKKGETIKSLKGHNEFSSVRFSFDGKTLAAASFDNTIRLWDTKTGIEKSNSPLIGHGNKVSSISFSHDGKYLASGSFDKTIRIWNLKTGEVKTLKGHTGKVESVSFSPDGKILASGSADKTIKLWDVTKGKEIKTFAQHQDNVLSVSFNADGTILASGSADEKIILWKIPGEQEINEAEKKDLEQLIQEGCKWVSSYLQNNPNVSENDKHLCD